MVVSGVWQILNESILFLEVWQDKITRIAFLLLKRERKFRPLVSRQGQKSSDNQSSATCTGSNSPPPDCHRNNFYLNDLWSDCHSHWHCWQRRSFCLLRRKDNCPMLGFLTWLSTVGTRLDLLFFLMASLLVCVKWSWKPIQQLVICCCCSFTTAWRCSQSLYTQLVQLLACL